MPITDFDLNALDESDEYSLRFHRDKVEELVAAYRQATGEIAALKRQLASQMPYGRRPANATHYYRDPVHGLSEYPWRMQERGVWYAWVPIHGWVASTFANEEHYFPVTSELLTEGK